MITGAGAGVGRAVTRAFARAGAKNVIILGRKLETLEGTKEQVESMFPSTKVHPLAVDIREQSTIEGRISALRDAMSLDVIDILVHNAGYLSDVGPVATSSAGDWWEGF